MLRVVVALLTLIPFATAFLVPTSIAGHFHFLPSSSYGGFCAYSVLLCSTCSSLEGMHRGFGNFDGVCC